MLETYSNHREKNSSFKRKRRKQGTSPSPFSFFFLKVFTLKSPLLLKDLWYFASSNSGVRKQKHMYSTILLYAHEFLFIMPLLTMEK